MKTRIFLAACALVAGSTAASADPITVGSWYTFGFGEDTGSALVNGSGYTTGTDPDSLSAPDTPWTFTLGALGGTLTVTDGFLAGDQFALSDFGATIGATSVPASTTADCSNDITACLNDANFSHGVFALSAGTHSITGSTLLNPHAGGAGFFIVQSTMAGVPEPGSWAMMIAGMGLAGAALRRRTHRVSYAV